jgi:hypothetical protein
MSKCTGAALLLPNALFSVSFKMAVTQFVESDDEILRKRAAGAMNGSMRWGPVK